MDKKQNIHKFWEQYHGPANEMSWYLSLYSEQFLINISLHVKSIFIGFHYAESNSLI